jgi:exodeoxyribonuclease VII large subunit
LQLASKLNDKKTRLAVLRQKQMSAIGDVVDAKNAALKIGMASLDALSPLAVLSRGFSIVETEAGAILRDAADVKANEDVKIRLARGKIKAKVTLIEK